MKVSEQVKNALQEVKNEKKLLHSILIERVDNGYIIYENEHFMRREPTSSDRKVFETKETLFEFLINNI